MGICKRGLTWALGLFSIPITILPESVFSYYQFLPQDFFEKNDRLSWIDVDDCNIIISRIILFLLIYIGCLALSFAYSRLMKRVRIEGTNYSIIVEYGNLLKKKKGQRVINFDECFTSIVGNRPEDIKPTSVCGQYLLKNPMLNMQQILLDNGVHASGNVSKFRNQVCYEPGTLVPYGDDLLMAYSKLEETGICKKFTFEEYLKCLEKLWEGIDTYYCNKDVYVPVLGSGMGRFENGVSQSFSKQELVDLMLASYRLSPHKLKANNTLHIVCTRSKDFSMDKVV